MLPDPLKLIFVLFAVAVVAVMILADPLASLLDVDLGAMALTLVFSVLALAVIVNLVDGISWAVFVATIGALWIAAIPVFESLDRRAAGAPRKATLHDYLVDFFTFTRPNPNDPFANMANWRLHDAPLIAQTWVEVGVPVFLFAIAFGLWSRSRY